MKIGFLLFLMGCSFCAGMAIQAGKGKAAGPARVTGIGGVFFKSADPAKLNAWYEKHLGIKAREGAKPGEPPMFEWRDKQHPDTVGVTVWYLFPKDSKYFAPSFMINYRVDDLDRLLAQLRAAGVKVDSKTSADFNGKFGWAMDPEGNRIELWEPK